MYTIFVVDIISFSVEFSLSTVFMGNTPRCAQVDNTGENPQFWKRRTKMALHDGKEKKSPTFAKMFRDRLKELGIGNPRQFAQEIEVPYDPIRKIYNGEDFPGPGRIEFLCECLGLDLTEAKTAVNKDKARVKGWVPEKLANHDVVLVKVSDLWNNLNEGDKQEILALVRTKADRAPKRGGQVA